MRMVQASVVTSVQQHKQAADAKQQAMQARAAQTAQAYTPEDVKHQVEKASMSSGMRHSDSATKATSIKSSAAELEDVHNKKAAMTDAGARGKAFTQPTDWTWDEVNLIAKSGDWAATPSVSGGQHFLDIQAAELHGIADVL